MFDLLKIVNVAELDLSEDTWESIDTHHSFGDCAYSIITWEQLLDHACENDFDKLQSLNYNFVNLA